MALRAGASAILLSLPGLIVPGCQAARPYIPLDDAPRDAQMHQIEVTPHGQRVKQQADRTARKLDPSNVAPRVSMAAHLDLDLHRYMSKAFTSASFLSLARVGEPANGTVKQSAVECKKPKCIRPEMPPVPDPEQFSGDATMFAIAEKYVKCASKSSLEECQGTEGCEFNDGEDALVPAIKCVPNLKELLGDMFAGADGRAAPFCGNITRALIDHPCRPNSCNPEVCEMKPHPSPVTCEEVQRCSAVPEKFEAAEVERWKSLNLDIQEFRKNVWECCKPDQCSVIGNKVHCMAKQIPQQCRFRDFFECISHGDQKETCESSKDCVFEQLSEKNCTDNTTTNRSECMPGVKLVMELVPFLKDYFGQLVACEQNIKTCSPTGLDFEFEGAAARMSPFGRAATVALAMPLVLALLQTLGQP